MRSWSDIEFLQNIARAIRNWIEEYTFFCKPRKLPFLFHEAGDGAHQIVLGEDFETRVAHFDKDRRILVAEDLRDALDGRGLRHLRERLAHHFADDELAKILALQRKIEDLVFVDRADGNVFLENGNLRDVLLLHGLQGVKDGLVRTRNDQFTNFAAGVLRVNDFRRGDGGG